MVEKNQKNLIKEPSEAMKALKGHLNRTLFFVF